MVATPYDMVHGLVTYQTLFLVKRTNSGPVLLLFLVALLPLRAKHRRFVT